MKKLILLLLFIPLVSFGQDLAFIGEKSYPSTVEFGFDNSEALIKELVWESGGVGVVKWMFYGAPAAGNGVLGALEMGCNVIALAADTHHKEHFQKALLQKAVESSLGGRSVAFGNQALLLRAKQLNVMKGEKPEPSKQSEDKEKVEVNSERAKKTDDEAAKEELKKKTYKQIKCLN